MLGAGQTAGDFEALVERSGGKRSEQAEDGSGWWPSLNLLQCAVGYAHGIVVHAKDERSDVEDVALGEAREEGGVLTGLVESFVDVVRVGGWDGFHAHEDQFPSRGGDEV